MKLLTNLFSILFLSYKNDQLSITAFSIGGILIVLLIVMALIFMPYSADKSNITGQRMESADSASTHEPLQSQDIAPTQTMLQKMDSLDEIYRRAKSESNQPAMIESLAQMHALNSDDKNIATKLAEEYYQQGLILRNGGNFKAAQHAYGNALNIEPNFLEAQSEQKLASLYLAGYQYHQQGAWQKAIVAFEQIYQRNPNYPFTTEIRYSVYYNLGMEQTNNNNLEQAFQSYRRANDILPQVGTARKKMEDVYTTLHPPTSTPTPVPTPIPTSTPVPSHKKIVVDISEQRAYTYDWGQPIHVFIISTGSPGRDTALGKYKIQNKIPMAYASTWNLDMPHWLGIYWAGSLQNGFHGLPTVRHTGYTLWSGHLGSRVSYGCIILSLEDARTLYNWADVGTDVVIRW